MSRLRRHSLIRKISFAVSLTAMSFLTCWIAIGHYVLHETLPHRGIASSVIGASVAIAWLPVAAGNT